MTNNNNNDDNVSNQKMVETSLMPRGSNLDEAVTNTGSNSVDDDDEDDIKYVHNDHENSTDMIIIASQQNPKRISSKYVCYRRGGGCLSGSFFHSVILFPNG